MMRIEPITLTGQKARLEPLLLEHAPALYEAIKETPNLWQYIYTQQPRSLEQMEQWVTQALQDQTQDTSLPFVIRDLANERIVGSTRYLRHARPGVPTTRKSAGACTRVPFQTSNSSSGRLQNEQNKQNGPFALR